MARRRGIDDELLFSRHIQRGSERAQDYREFLRRNARQPALAFVDESYRPSYTNQQGFYALTATIIDSRDVAQLREELKDQLGGSVYWHTTEAFQARSPDQARSRGLWYGNIQNMMNTAANRTDQAVITVHTAVMPLKIRSDQATGLTGDMRTRLATAETTALEQARAECMTTMLKTLANHPDGAV